MAKTTSSAIKVRPIDQCCPSVLSALWVPPMPPSWQSDSTPWPTLFGSEY